VGIKHEYSGDLSSPAALPYQGCIKNAVNTRSTQMGRKTSIQTTRKFNGDITASTVLRRSSMHGIVPAKVYDEHMGSSDCQILLICKDVANKD